MNENEITQFTDIFLEEQEWVQPFRAPVLVWGLFFGSVIMVAGTAFWIYQHNKE